MRDKIISLMKLIALNMPTITLIAGFILLAVGAFTLGQAIGLITSGVLLVLLALIQFIPVGRG